MCSEARDEVFSQVIDLSSEEALALCAQFVGGPWLEISTNDFQIKILAGGMSSRLYVCEQLAAQTTTKVLIRLYGGKIVMGDHPYRTLTEAGEVLLYQKMGELGLGPRLLGVFAGGRLEQYIEGRPLANDEHQDPEVEDSFARCLARMHHMQLPLSRKPRDQIAIAQMMLEDVKRNVMHVVRDDLMTRFAYLFEFPFEEETRWLRNVFSRVKTKVVLCHGDMNRANCIVVGKQTFLVDYEFSGYSYRGSDLGAHFNNWMFEVTNHVDFLSNGPFPSDEQRKKFLESYIDECKVLGDWDDDLESDSYESLEFETDFYSLVYPILMCTWFLRDFHQVVSFGDAFFLYMTFYLKFYEKQKSRFLEKYTDKL